MTQSGEMQQAFVDQGLQQVAELELLVRMDYESFEDFWAPFATGEGSIGKFVDSLAPNEVNKIIAAIRDAYEGGRLDGPRSFASTARACRGIVPRF
jgi:hypothetical protein